jgi:Tol biopolymer transport system component
MRAGTQGNMFDVWRMDIDGGNPKQLTNGELALFPQIAPDGKTIVYVSTASGKPTIWKTTIDGDKPVQLTPNISQYPAISPDGKMVACVYSDSKPGSRPTIAVIPIDGGEPITIVKKIGVGRVQWTPDGKSLAYIDSHEGINNMFTIPIDGGEPKQLTQFNSDYLFWFAFSNDFKQLLCTRGTVAFDVVLINDTNQK